MNRSKAGKRTLIFLTLAVLLIAGCATTGGTSHEDFAEIAQRSLDSYGAALIAGDIESWLALHDEDVMKLPQDRPAIVGMDALREDISTGLKVVEFLDFGCDSQEFVVFGEYGYARGNYFIEQRLRATGQMLPRFEGKYLTVYRRQTDGSWRIFRDSYSSNQPPAG